MSSPEDPTTDPPPPQSLPGPPAPAPPAPGSAEDESSSSMRHRGSSGGSSTSTTTNQSGGSNGSGPSRAERMSSCSSVSASASASCGGLQSLNSLGARSTWSIREEDGDEDSEGRSEGEEQEEDDDDSLGCQGGRSRETSSASLSMLFPSRLTFHLPAHLEHLDGEDTRHPGSARVSMASSKGGGGGGDTGPRASTTSTITGSHDRSHQSDDHSHPPRSPVGIRERWGRLLPWRKTGGPASPGPSPSARRHHPRRPRAKIVSPALAHFRAKVNAAVRTALAAGMAAAISQFVWAWSNTYTWFTITLCISGTRQSLGETLSAAYDFWHGACLLLPLLYLIRIVRGHTALVAIGLFLAVVAIIAYPNVSDAGKRMATTLLALVVLAGERNPDVAYYTVTADLFLTLLMSNVFSVAALLLPLPTAALALFDVRRQLKTLRHRLGALLRGFDHAFGLGEEVHHSMLEQLLEEGERARGAVKALLPYLHWEMALLRMPRRAHAHLVAYLEVVDRQLQLLRGLKLSLRRIPANNGTHREFLRFIHRPLGSVLLACVAVTDAAGRQVEAELLIFPWLRQRQLQRQEQRQHQQQHQQEGRRSTTALPAHGFARRPTTASQHPDQRRRAVTSSNPGDDLDALATIAETRLDVLMAEYLKARLAIFFGFKVETTIPEESVGGRGYNVSSPFRQAALHALLMPTEEEQQQREEGDAQPDAEAASTTAGLTSLDASSAASARTTGHVRMATGAGMVGKDALTLTLTKRRMSGETVYSTFQKEFERIGVTSVMPRNAFLMDVSLYVRSLDDLVAACSVPSSAASAAPAHLSWLPSTKAIWAPVAALWKRRPWAPAPPTVVDANAAADPRGRTATTATAATTLSGKTQGSGGDGGAGTAPVHSKSHATPAGAAPQQPWTRRLLRRLRQPVKVALAVLMASLGLLIHIGPASTWAVVAVCQSLSSHPGSSFRSAYNRIQGTVLGGMAGIAALEWCGLTSPPAIVAFISLWTLLCCFSRRSLVYGETAVVAALTCPIIMLGPVSGEQGAMLRVEQTVLGCLIYSFIDNLVYPVRAKIDLRRELVASLDTFSELWTRAFNVFLERGGGQEEAARAQASYVRLTASFAQQEQYIVLALEEPEIWHKPFQAVAYRKVVGTLTQASLFLSMLVRASAAFPSELSLKDRAMHAAIQGAVADLEHATCQALEQARQAVLNMKRRGPLHAHRHVHVKNHARGSGAALPVTSAPAGTAGGYHRRKKQAAAARPMSPTSAQAFALLRLAGEYGRLKEFVDSFWGQHIETKRAQEDTALVSAEFILSISSMLFAIDCLGEALVKVGHALRELVERERTNAYKL